MEKTKLIEDFNQLYIDLQSHPFLIDFPEKIEEFHKLYTQRLGSISDYSSFLDSLTALTCFFQDGHTNIELPYQNSDLCIPIRCAWENEKLFVTEQYEEIPEGAELIRIEELPINVIIKKLAKTIPHENSFLVKSRAVEYPYVNYHIFSQQNLTKLIGEKTKYEITYKHEGKTGTTYLQPVPYNGYLDFCDDQFISWKIEGNNATLKLDACICNHEYETALHELATACNAEKINTLILDLSKNMGGTSEVIEKFLEYVDIDSFRRYEMIDYSTGKPEQICSRTDIIPNAKKESLFPNKIICKIGNTTFSSARTFAVTLYDNRIASIIGEPSGGKPSSYGMPRKSTLKNTGIRYRISRAWFGRPNASLDHQESLVPAIHLSL